MTSKPNCPRCQTNRHVNSHDGDLFYCGKCHGIFDNSDDGGDYSDTNPAARLERLEREQQRKHERRFARKR